MRCPTEQLRNVGNVIELPVCQLHGGKDMGKSFPFVFLVALMYPELFYGSRWAPLELLFFHKALPCPYGRESLIVIVHTVLRQDYEPKRLGTESCP